MSGLIVIKIGGATLGSHDTALEDIVQLQKQGESVVVIHGGGKLITEWLEKQGIPSHFIRGERVTDKPALDVATAVLCGLVNKDITASIIKLGGKAAGISGVDGSVIEGEVREKEKGYVGFVTSVNTHLLKALLKTGIIPIIAPIGLNSGEMEPGDPAILNYNADIVAGEIAAALSAAKLIFLTDVDGIKNTKEEIIPELTMKQATELIESGIASGGMIPKIYASLKAITAETKTRIIDGRKQHALIKELETGTGGTTIKR